MESSMTLRSDASVELLGFALWTYWEEEWMPALILDSSLPPPSASSSSPDEEKIELERAALLDL